MQSKAIGYEVELEQFRQQSQYEGSSAALRLRDKDRRITALEDELESSRSHTSDLERMLRDSRAKVGGVHRNIIRGTKFVPLRM